MMAGITDSEKTEITTLSELITEQLTEADCFHDVLFVEKSSTFVNVYSN